VHCPGLGSFAIVFRSCEVSGSAKVRHFRVVEARMAGAWDHVHAVTTAYCSTGNISLLAKTKPTSLPVLKARRRCVREASVTSIRDSRYFDAES
jgi:hypothetical protein